LSCFAPSSPTRFSFSASDAHAVMVMERKREACWGEIKRG